MMARELDEGGMNLTRLERERIQAVERSGLMDGRTRPALDIVARNAALSLRASMGFVSIIGRDRQHAIGSHGIELPPVPRGQSFCHHTIAGLEPLVVGDTRIDPRFAHNPFVLAEPYLRAYAGVPLIDDEGHALGALCVAERYARSFEAGELLSLLRLGDMAVRLIESEARECRRRLAS